MTSGTKTYLELIRPANVVTAFADILAGFAAAGAFGRLFSMVDQAGLTIGVVSTDLVEQLIWLLLATAGLYAGGVVLNDVYDAHIDAVERPERPIPSGRISRSAAAIFGTLLLLGGVASAALAGLTSLVLAALVAACAVTYDAAGKHRPILGPINMGLCRGGNLLLGVSAVPAMLAEVWFLALVPVAYIGAVTAISRGEVTGGERTTGILALLLVGTVTAALLLLGIRLDYRIINALPFIALFAALVFPTFARAAVHPSPEKLRTAVKTGVLSLVALNAAVAAGFAGWIPGLIVLALLPISYVLGRAFAVT